ncbi:MAG: hypothetical protein E6Q91_00375 [Actinobacteria bacterium]|nr:MAG: hypothetical protein E6Q91_00375 [Actinomycetota bacterium]
MANTRETRQLNAMAVGFGVGSALFAAGAMLSVMQADVVFTSVVYALGAVCFTTAAGVQWRSAADHHPPSRLKDPDWMSAAIQFAGTLYFNVMTIRALILSIDATSVSYDAVWQPDVVGSLLFLISSWVAWHPIAREHRHHLLHGRSLLICWANMLGSVFFGISAVGAKMLPDGTLRNEGWNNWGTFLGAVGFFIAAMALRPTSQERRDAVSAQAGS